jgi:hypothetical protein
VAASSYEIKSGLWKVNSYVSVSKGCELVCNLSTCASSENVLLDYIADPTEEDLIKVTQEATSKGDAPDGCCGKTYITVSKDKTVRLVIKAIAGPPDVAGQKLKVNNIFLGKGGRGHLPER